MSEQDTRNCLHILLMTTTEDNIDENVDFLFNLLTQQGVTI